MGVAGKLLFLPAAILIGSGCARSVRVDAAYRSVVRASHTIPATKGQIEFRLSSICEGRVPLSVQFSIDGEIPSDSPHRSLMVACSSMCVSRDGNAMAGGEISIGEWTAVTLDAANRFVMQCGNGINLLGSLQ